MEFVRALRRPGGDRGYLNFVVDKFGLRGHMQFDTRIASAVFDEARCTWTLTTDSGSAAARPLRDLGDGRSLGHLSTGDPGRDTFKGEVYHTVSGRMSPSSSGASGSR